MDVGFQAENETKRGYLALPQSRQGPGVLLLHAWWGLTPFIESVCERLAQGGFVAFAPDLYSGKTTTEIEAAQLLATSLDDVETSAIVSAAAAFLSSHEAVTSERLGVVGFSLGAAYALRIAGPVGAAVLFYGVADAEGAPVDAAFQGHFGENDDFEPLDGVEELEQTLRSGGREVTFYTYPGMKHWFFEEDRPEYDQGAADLAWQRTLAFLQERLGTEQ